MFKNEPRALLPGLKTISIITVCSLALSGAVPEGWVMSGSTPTDYESAVDSQTVYNGRPSAYLRYVSTAKPTANGFGTLMQNFSARQYNDQRVRFSGYVKSEAVEDWAGLWMRVDRGNRMTGKTVSFDNMQDRPIKGTTVWHWYEVVLDVPDGSTLIALGILMGGKGTVWLNSASFEIVPKSVPVTGKTLGPALDGPVNLSFDQ
jgi:hypothetical protein